MLSTILWKMKTILETILRSLSKKQIIVSFIVDEDNNIVNIVHIIHVYCWYCQHHCFIIVVFIVWTQQYYTYCFYPILLSSLSKILFNHCNAYCLYCSLHFCHCLLYCQVIVLFIVKTTTILQILLILFKSLFLVC